MTFSNHGNQKRKSQVTRYENSESRITLLCPVPHHAAIFDPVTHHADNLGPIHPRRPRDSQWGGEKRRDESFQVRAKEPQVLILTEPFPKIQADAHSWLGTKNALYYCVQSANSFSWILFVSPYTTAIVSITACLTHAPKKCTQSGN